MIRFLAVWIVLYLVLVVTARGTSFLVFRHVDLRYEMFVAVVVTPPLQALAVMWATSGLPDAAVLRATARDAWRHPLVIPVVALDIILMSAGWILWQHPHLGLSGTVSVHPAWFGTKTIAAALFFLFFALRGNGAAPLRAGERATVIALALVLLTAGSAGFSPWIGPTSEALFAAWRRVPTVLRWLGAYGSLFVVGVAVSVAAARTLGRRCRSAQVLCDAAVALSLVAAVLVVLEVFLRPYVGEPSRSVALTCGSLGATLLLIAGILVAAPSRVGIDAR